MAQEMWNCPCGRRVPGHVDTCRCGRPRPADPVPRAPAPGPSTESSSSIYQSTGLRAVGALVVMVLGYFGSRACNREMVSRDARQQAEHALTEVLGAEGAKTAMSRHHRACFDETYSVGWGRRQSSKFDGEKYVACVTDRVRTDPVRTGGRGESRPPVPATPPPTRDTSGPLRIDDARVYLYEPPGHFVAIAIKVSGEPLPAHTEAACRMVCDGAPLSPDFGDCGRLELGFQGDPATAVVAVTWETMPRCSSVAVELGLAVRNPRPPPRSLPVTPTVTVRVPDRPVRVG